MNFCRRISQWVRQNHLPQLLGNKIEEEFRRCKKVKPQITRNYFRQRPGHDGQVHIQKTISDVLQQARPGTNKSNKQNQQNKVEVQIQSKPEQKVDEHVSTAVFEKNVFSIHVR